MTLKIRRSAKAEELAKEVHTHSSALSNARPHERSRLDLLIRDKLCAFLVVILGKKNFSEDFTGIDGKKKTVDGHKGEELEILFTLNRKKYLLRTFKSDDSDYFTWNVLPYARFREQELLAEVPRGAILEATANTTHGELYFDSSIRQLSFTSLDKSIVCRYILNSAIMYVRGTIEQVETGAPKIFLDALAEAKILCVPRSLWQDLETRIRLSGVQGQIRITNENPS